MFELDELKGATLDDGKFSALKSHVDDILAQRDAARQESISGRKGKDAKLADLQAQLDKATARIEVYAEKLGVEPDADLDALPSAKGQAEAAKQFESRVKKLQRDLDDKARQFDDLAGRHSAYVRESQIVKAMEGHRFKNPGDVRVLIERRVKQEGDDLLFETDDGKLVPLREGVAWFGKTRTDYVEPADAGGHGSGYRSGSSNGSSGKTMPLAQFLAQTPKDRAKAMADGMTLVDA